MSHHKYLSCLYKVQKINSGICPSSWKGQIKTSTLDNIYCLQLLWCHSTVSRSISVSGMHFATNDYIWTGQTEIQAAQPAPVHLAGMEIPEVEAQSQMA